MNSTSLSSELFVHYGAVPNDGTGDPLRDAFIKTQTNINYLFNFLNNNPYFPNATIGNAFITAANISTLTTNTSTITNLVVGSEIVGNLTASNLTGTSIYGTIMTPSQPNITTLNDIFITGNLSVGGNTTTLNASEIVGNLTASNLTGTSIYGTIMTPSQPNITTLNNIFITGNLSVVGNTTTLNASNLVISDSIIYLADSNPSDLLTIGMVADYNTNGIGGNVHTGLVRSSVTKEWYLFDNYGPNDPQSLVNFDLISSNINLSTLNANTVTQAPNDNSNKLASTAYVDKLSYYDIAGGSTGSPTASAKLLTFVAVRNMSLPTNLTGSYCVAGTAATATTTITLNKNGSSFGNISFAAAATIATFTVAATSFIAGDIITVVASATPDTTLADIGFTLTGTL